MASTIEAVLSELIAERGRIDTAIAALQPTKRRGRPPGKKNGRKRGRPKK